MTDPEQIVNDFSGHVRGLLNRAEELATQIVRQAETDAAVIRDRAEAEAARIREPAEATARRAEMGARGLLAAFRNALDELETSLGLAEEGPSDTDLEPSGAPEAEPARRLVIEPERERRPIPEPTREAAPDPISSPATAPQPSPEPLEREQPPPPEADELRDRPPQAADEAVVEAARQVADPEDEDAARLVAMKLAIEGVSREDAKARLLADFKLRDVDALIDEVFARSPQVARVRRWVPGIRRTR